MNIDPINSDPMRALASSGEIQPQGSTETRAAAPAATSSTVRAPNPAEVQASVDNANRQLQGMNQSLQFELDRTTGKTIVRVVDTNTKEVLRQFPSEEMLAIARALTRARGLLLNEKA